VTWSDEQVLWIFLERYLTLQIITGKLDIYNYLAWLQFALLYIKSRGKIGYLNGKIQEAKLDDLVYDRWEAKIPILSQSRYT
jgi:hypothetical protein